MPKFILATVVLFFGRQGPPGADAAHDAMHARTRSRDTTRRLRASRLHDPHFNLGALGLNQRH